MKSLSKNSEAQVNQDQTQSSIRLIKFHPRFGGFALIVVRQILKKYRIVKNATDLSQIIVSGTALNVKKKSSNRLRQYINVN